MPTAQLSLGDLLKRLISGHNVPAHADSLRAAWRRRLTVYDAAMDSTCFSAGE